MAGTKGAETRIQYSQGRDAYTIIQWTDTAAVVGDEFTVTNLPPLFRLLKWKVTASAGTVNSRFTNVSGAAVGAAGDLGQCATTAAQINEELNLLIDLATVNGTFFYKDLSSTTSNNVHVMIIKAGA
jgi:hypothetical protein